MAESLGSAVLTLTTDDRGLDEGLRRGESKAEATAERFIRIGGRMKDVGANLSVAMTLPIGAFAVAAANAASDAQELQSAFDVTFGAMAGDMNEWARATGDAMGRSTQEIQQAANTFGMFFNQAAPTKQAAAEMSQEFAKLAQDLSSFYNVDPGEAMAKLRSGLSGETEPLRDFGIFMTDASMKAKALQMGLGGVSGELTEQQKIMVRAAIIMESTKNAQGDVARTSAGTANQVRAARAAWDELQVSVGTRLLPIFTPLITALSSVLNTLTGLPAPVQTTIAVVAALAAGIGPLLVGLGLMSTGIGTLIPILTGLGTAFAVARTAALATLPALGPFLVPLAALAAAIGVVWLAWQNWDRITGVLDATRAAISGWWTGSVQPTLTAIGAAVKAVIAIWTDAFGAQLRRVVDGVGRMLRGDFAGAFRAIAGFVQEPLNLALTAIERFAPGATAAFRKVYDGAKEWLQNKLGGVIDWVKEQVDKVTGLFTVSGPERSGGGPGGAQAAMAAVLGWIDYADVDRRARLASPAPAPPVPDAEVPEEVRSQWSDSFRQAFGDGIRAAMVGDLGGFIDNFFEQNISRAFDKAVDWLWSLLDRVFGQMGGGGGGGGGGFGAALGSLFSGFFATGGLIPSGTFGIVGERGPEPVIASPKGALVRPSSTLSTARMQPASPSVSMPITIDATGADAAAIGRLNSKLDQLRGDLPGVALRTVQDAGERGLLNTSAWRR